MSRKLTMKRTLLLIGVAGFIYAAMLQVQISRHAIREVPIQADYVIVLGARVKGTVPSLALQARIDAAAEYLIENGEAIVIASGGKGAGEDISEAECIKRGLIQQGIAESRIILEDQSTDTYENIAYSKKLLPEESAFGLVATNDFHIFRAKMIAADEKLTIDGLPAKTPIQALFKSYTREYLALTKYFLKSFFKTSE